jgi:hypothetical protein
MTLQEITDLIVAVENDVGAPSAASLGEFNPDTSPALARVNEFEEQFQRRGAAIAIAAIKSGHAKPATNGSKNTALKALRSLEAVMKWRDGLYVDFSRNGETPRFFFQGDDADIIETFDAAISTAWGEKRDEDPECPGPDCLMCSGEACNLCGAGCWNNKAEHCEHGSVERHEAADYAGENNGG